MLHKCISNKYVHASFSESLDKHFNANFDFKKLMLLVYRILRWNPRIFHYNFKSLSALETENYDSEREIIDFSYVM